MKNIMKSLGFLALFAILLSTNSCEEVEDILPVPSMKATVDDVAWTSLFRATVLFESNGVFSITGTPDASENVDKAIILTINGTEVGTYDLSPGTLTAECGVVYKKTADAAYGGDNYYISHTASITISKLDKDKKQISGTFSATLIAGTTEVVITNGTFENLNYQVEQ